MEGETAKVEKKIDNKKTMTKKKIFVVGVIGVALLIGGGLALSKTIFAKDNYSTDKKATKEMIPAIMSDIREKCKMTDEEIIKEGLTKQDVKKVRDFCNLSDKEMKKVLKERIEERKTTGGDNIGILSYGCWYYGYNKGIPSYSDLGLSSASCDWHKSTPYSCKVEGGVACLWGCSNSDPNLGWHEKRFDNQAQLENEIYSKGYHRTAGYAVGQFWKEFADTDYTRAVSYGYRHQVMWYKDRYLNAHTEGPEPNAEINWYGWIQGFWPDEVNAWHHQC